MEEKWNRLKIGQNKVPKFNNILRMVLSATCFRINMYNRKEQGYVLRQARQARQETAHSVRCIGRRGCLATSNHPEPSGTILDFKGCPAYPVSWMHVLGIQDTCPGSPSQHCVSTVCMSKGWAYC